jgi:hypothetical protein
MAVGTHPEIINDRKGREDMASLRDMADPLGDNLMRAQVGDVLLFEEDSPFGGLQNSGEGK